MALVLSLVGMEAGAPLSVPSLSLWFCLVHVYFSWDSAKILPEAGWVLTTCVQYVPTCLLSICSFGCIQYMCNMNTHTIKVAPRCCTVHEPLEAVRNGHGSSEFQCRQVL